MQTFTVSYLYYGEQRSWTATLHDMAAMQIAWNIAAAGRVGRDCPASVVLL